MATALVFLGLVASSLAQNLIYPDDFVKRMRAASTYPTELTSTPRPLVSRNPGSFSHPGTQPLPHTGISSAYAPSGAAFFSPQVPLSAAFPSQQLPAAFPSQQLPVGLPSEQLPEGVGFSTAKENVSAVLPSGLVSGSPVNGATYVPQQQSIDIKLQHWNNHVNDIIVKGILKFTLDLEREIYKSSGATLTNQRPNIVFSPINLAITMAVVLAGSAGRTFDEVSRVLGLESGVDISRHSEIVHQVFGMTLNQLRSRVRHYGSQSKYAIALLVQEGFPIRPEFHAITKNVYQNDVLNVDFMHNGKATQNMVNTWVKEKTNGKISSILSDVPPPQTTLILLAALYFKAEWNQHFITAATKKKPFFIEENESVTVDMMYNAGTFLYYEDRQLGAKIVSLPYIGHEASMYMILPTVKGARALRNFQNQLTAATIEQMIANMTNETCIIAMPRMKLSSSLSLRSTLANLGLTSLFDPATADLSLMSQRQGVNTVVSPLIPTLDAVINRKRENDMPQPEAMLGTRSQLVSPDTKEAEETQARKNFFSYKDPINAYTVEQWSTGFSIKKNRRARDSGSKGVNDQNAGSVKGEDNIHRDVAQGRAKRQSRPIDPNFVKFLKHQNFSTYGLDELRNSDALVNPHIYASDVLHKVEIDITEKGTEAAVVTAILVERDGSQKRIIGNRPFTFFIRHNLSKLVLFWGTVNTPVPNYNGNT